MAEQLQQNDAIAEEVEEAAEKEVAVAPSPLLGQTQTDKLKAR